MRRSPTGVTPKAARLIAHDRRDAHHARATDIVPGPGPATRRFADLAIRRPVGATLDLGCGQGALSVLAAAHSARVTAVDLNPRATALSAFNAELNGFGNIACRQGDLFAPVAGQRFDLIVSNPPFVISPASTFLYRDGGGGICERIVREAPAYLAEGGVLQVVCNWPCYRGRDWKEDLAGWFRGSGCDVWILETDHHDAAVYAGIWLRQEHEDLSQMGPEFDRWVAYYENAGIEAVGGGIVAMRSPVGRASVRVGRASVRVGRASVPVSSDHWLEIRDMPPCIGPAGETIDRVLEAREVLARLSDDATLLGSKLRLAPEARAFVTERPSQAGWEREAAELRLTEGLAMALRLDPVGAALAGFLDGGRTAGEAVAAFAASSGVPVEALLPGVPALVRRMIELGLVVLPAAESSACRTGGD